MRENKMMRELKEGRVVYGPFVKITDPATVEIAAYSGFDFVIIDLEHGPHSIEGAQNLIRAAELSDITPVVRVLENNPTHILRALDIGAQGIEVPHISNKEDARKTVRAARFSPQGERGLCRFVRAANYSSVPSDEYIPKENEEIVVIVHIEGVEGVKNLRDILEVEGIDIIFLGPYDLSQSCGVPGKVDHPAVAEKMEEAVRIAKEAGVKTGTFVDNLEQAKRWKKAGVQYISFSVDVGIYYEACSQIVKRLKE
ncbi:aldolase [Candidatus Aerophobetes bacterium]|nr:aldolase [Candidatus Aerophobetes bacterium]